MLPLVALLVIVLPACFSLRLHNCIEHNNPGVYNEFGPLPSRLYDPTYFYKIDTLGKAFSVFSMRGAFQKYMMEYYEYQSRPGAGNEIYAYHRLMFHDGIQYRTLDYIRVNPSKWYQVESAIVDADTYPTSDKKLRVKFMLHDCYCVMRVYDLTVNDIISWAKTESCDGHHVLNNHHHSIHNPGYHYSSSDKLKHYGVADVVPSCTAYQNNGVYNEFGHLPQGLVNQEFYRKDTNPGYAFNSFTFEGNLQRYKVEYTQYIEQIGIGYNVYGYQTLHYNNAGTDRILDYLRVHPQKWRNVQYAILDASLFAGEDYKLRIMYLTQECLCVLRVYDLSVTDIPGYATTYACNGSPISTIPHTVSLGLSRIRTFPDVQRFQYNQRYPDCVPDNNNGVLDTFGPLPLDIDNVDYFYEVVNTGIRSKSKNNLYGKLQNYLVEYKEFKEQPAIGFGTYAYLALYYDAKSNVKLLDYLRVNAMKWRQIQSAILFADYVPTNNNKLRMSFLTADCTCVMRVYDLSAYSIVDNGLSMSCDGQQYLATTTNTRKSLREETAELIRFHKTTYKNWSQYYTPLVGVAP